MTGLLERHGQGGVGDAVNAVAYWSSFLIADGTSAWVLETSGRSWAARPVERGDAISNRLTLRRDWTRASPGVAPGTDLDTWRDPTTPTGFADGRLAASRAFVQRTPGRTRARGAGPTSARAVVAHLRDHGTGPWGAPGSPGPVVAAPTDVDADGTGVTVCMHIHDFEATTASMVAELARRRTRRRRAAGVGRARQSVCVGVRARAGAVTARRHGGRSRTRWPARRLGPPLRRAVARRGDRPGARSSPSGACCDAVEADLWDEADTLESLDAGPVRWQSFACRGRSAASRAHSTPWSVAGIGVGGLTESSEGPG